MGIGILWQGSCTTLCGIIAGSVLRTNDNVFNIILPTHVSLSVNINMGGVSGRCKQMSCISDYLVEKESTTYTPCDEVGAPVVERVAQLPFGLIATRKPTTSSCFSLSIKWWLLALRCSLQQKGLIRLNSVCGADVSDTVLVANSQHSENYIAFDITGDRSGWGFYLIFR